jgi:hypothetical protein
MEKFLVNTKRLPCTVNISINTDGSTVPVYIVGVDPLNQNTLYFRSRFQLTGSENLSINLPQSPIMLQILVWAEDSQPYELSSIDVTHLEAGLTDDPSIIFIQNFARICGRLRPGIYKAENVPFIIEFKRNIYTDNGDDHPTPARIHEDMPIIQVSEQKFDQNTIPERVIILLHEYSHNFINQDPDNEQEADENAKQIYLSLGYPKFEGVHAFGDIMADTDDNYQRMLNLTSM